MIQLRDYQQELYNKVNAAWNAGHQNVLAVSATGSGKTVVMSAITRDNSKDHVVVIAHRGELVNQISSTLAVAGVRNQIIASKSTIKDTVNSHVRKTGKSYYDPNSKVIVASVATLLKKAATMQPLFNRVKLWLIDECHHVVEDNQWGKASKLFPNAKGLGVTATPTRADGKGLGRDSDGVFDVIVQGPPMRWLIDNGFLTDYKIYCPPNDLDLSKVTISKSSGDYVTKQVDDAVKKSHMMGDVVDHYLRLVPGKQAIVFYTSVAVAEEAAIKFQNAGVKAVCVHGGTSDHLRTSQLLQFENREIQVLTNVDLFGEGFDVPAIEVVIMARPTESYGLYSQMFGRALRTLEGKENAIIIDHVGNVLRHNLPDREVDWTLDRREKRGSSKSIKDAIPLKTCTECLAPYEAIYKICPHCGAVDEPKGRSSLKEVEGDLTELDSEVLAALRGEIKRIDDDAQNVMTKMKFAGVSPHIVGAAARKHWDRQQAQMELRNSMANWAGIRRHDHGETNDVIMKRFYYTFGIDMGTAQTLGTTKAGELKERVDHEC